MTPSVSAEELKHYERLREQFSSLQGPRLGNGGDGGKQQRGQQLAKAAVRSPPASKGQGDARVMEEVWSSLGAGRGGEGAGGGKEER